MLSRWRSGGHIHKISPAFRLQLDVPKLDSKSANQLPNNFQSGDYFSSVIRDHLKLMDVFMPRHIYTSHQRSI